MVAIPKRVAWTQKDVEEIKFMVKSQLDIQNDSDSRLELIKKSINQLADDPSPRGQLQRFVMIISALAHHIRHGGMTDSQVRMTAKVAESILKAQGIQPESSNLSFLYGDLQLALSQIYELWGDKLRSLWEQQLCYHMARKSPPGGEQFQHLSTGLRYLRLGHIQSGLVLLERAEKETLSHGLQFLSRINRIKSMRVLGQLSAADELTSVVRKDLTLSQEEEQELAWEEIIRGVLRTQNLNDMIRAVRRNGSHDSSVYISEAQVWALAVQSTSWRAKLPKVSYLVKHSILKPKVPGFFFKCMQRLVDCYDADIPLTIRIRGLGGILSELNLLGAVDKEILVWAAATRWLARSQQYELALIALKEYHALNLKITDGVSKDPSGLLSDLGEKDWLLLGNEG